MTAEQSATPTPLVAIEYWTDDAVRAVELGVDEEGWRVVQEAFEREPMDMVLLFGGAGQPRVLYHGPSVVLLAARRIAATQEKRRR